MAALGSWAIGCSRDVEARLAEVRALQDVGQYTASLEDLNEILSVAPDLPEANYRLGVALIQTGNPSRAVWALQKASESKAYQISATLLLAQIQFSLNNFEEAVRAADRVLEMKPDNRAALETRAQANLGIHRLDEALADTSQLIERYPDSYAVLVIHATVLAEMGNSEEAEAAQYKIKEVSEASGDPQAASRGCLAPALYADENLEDSEKAEELYNDCAARYPADAFIIAHIINFFDGISKPERGTELLRLTIEEVPEVLTLRSQLAKRLANHGDVESAEALLREAVDRFGSAAAWNLLVEHYRQQRKPARALEAVEKVIELTGGGGDQVRFTYADLLVDVGELDRAEDLARSFDERAYTALIRGRILLARGENEAALAAFDAGLADWPNNAGARYLAGVAALRLGDFERAAVELRESVRVDDTETDAARVLAKLLFERGDYDQALGFSQLAEKRVDPAQLPHDLKLAARTYASLGRFDEARAAAHALARLSGHAAEAAAERAIIERMAKGPEAAVAAIEALELDLADSANLPALRALCEHLGMTGEFDRAVTYIDAALARTPDSAELNALLGETLATADRTEAARRAFERALEIDAEQPQALGGLGTLMGVGGDTTSAIDLLGRAADLTPNSEAYRYSAAQLLLAAGSREAAETSMRAIIMRSAGHAASRNDLAWILAEDGRELDLALSLASEASRLSPEPEIFDTLGFVYLKRGEAALAVEALERAVAGRPGSPSIRYRLGTALRQTGDSERARAMLTDALEAGAFPEAEAARRELALLAQG